MKRRNFLFLTGCFILLSSYCFVVLADTIAEEDEMVLSRLSREWEQYKMYMQDQDLALKYFTDGANYFWNKGDTANYLNCKIYLSKIEMRQGHFNKSFDLIWDIYPIANKIGDKDPLIQVHQMLGILYGIYGKDSVALEHTKLGHELAFQTSEDWTAPVSSYLDVAIRYIEMEQYVDALKYLDSCYLVNTPGGRLPFIDANYGLVYMRTGNYPKAKEYFSGIIPYFVNLGIDYQAAVYYYVGDLKSGMNEPDSAIWYYEKSLKAIDSLQTNFKLKPEVLEKLAEACFHLNENQKAYQYMKEAKAVSDSMFNTQSLQNKTLFEIKNKYREDLVKQQKQIDSQNELLALNRKARLRLKLIIGTLILLTLITIVAFRLIYKMRRMGDEKEKNDAMLEFRNRELTANALQIVEKERAVEELLEVLQAKAPEMNQELKRKYRQSSKKIWDDFHLRFTQTNNQFYDRLIKLHPDLTPTDLKHCALVRLNFDSKEMSHLLGISINSVHMARSRIRKKLGLKRDESLGGYLASL